MVTGVLSPDAVHPRVCGELNGQCIRDRFYYGSSPRVRGTACPGEASEDLDICRQAGEGCQVRDRDDVAFAKVEHHSAVRECRVG